MLNICAVTFGGSNGDDIAAQTGIGLAILIGVYYAGKFALDCCRECCRYHRVTIYETREVELNDEEMNRRASHLAISILENVQRQYASAVTNLVDSGKKLVEEKSPPPIPPRPGPPGMKRKEMV